MWQTVRICYPWHFRYNFPLKTPGHRAWVLQLKRPSVGFLWSITFLPHRWRHTPRKQPLTGRFWAAMLKAHNSEQNHFFELEKRQKITKKTSNINVRVLSINLKNGYFFTNQFSFKEGLCWFANITLVMQRLRLPCSKLSCCVLSFKKRLVFFKATFFPTMFRLSIVAKSKYTKVIHCLDLTLLTVSSNVYYFNLKLV